MNLGVNARPNGLPYTVHPVVMGGTWLATAKYFCIASYPEDHIIYLTEPAICGIDCAK